MDQLLYAELGPDNGSIVLNLSEDGCSFQSIAPIRSQELHYTFAIGGGQEIDGNARVVWVEKTGKVGGLRFINLSPKLREQIRAWLADPKAIDISMEPPAGGEVAAESDAKRRRRQLREEARLQWEAEQRRRQREERPAPQNVPLVPALQAEPGRDAQVLTIQSEQSRSGLWQGVAPVVIAALLVGLLITYHREAGHALMWLGSVIAGDDEESKTEPSKDGAKAPDNLPLVPAVRTASSGLSSGYPANNTSEMAQNDTDPSAPVASTGQALSGKIETPSDTYSSEDVQTLWTQVEGGDTRAEVELAERYSRGDGVTRSCGQARVLLEAATKRGNAEAKRKLDELSQTGCR